MVFSILLLTVIYDLLILCFSVSSTLHSIQRLSFILHPCDSSNLLVSAVRMSVASAAPLTDVDCNWTMLQLEEEGPLVQLHLRATVRSLNSKALKLTRVIWTVRFWSTSSTPASPNSNFPKPKLPWTPVSSPYVSISFSGSVQRRSWSAPVNRHPLITLNAFKEEGVCVFSCR